MKLKATARYILLASAGPAVFTLNAVKGMATHPKYLGGQLDCRCMPSRITDHMMKK